MKILLIDVNCKYSSTGKIVYDLYNHLRSDGYEAAIAYGRGSLVEGENIYKFGLDWETYLHAGLARITGYNGCYSYFSTRRLLRFIEEFQPDVIHIHELHAYFVNFSTLINYIKNKRIKTVWTFHCEYNYTGKCGHALDCLNYLHGCGNCPAVCEYPKSLWFDRTRRMLAEKQAMLSGLDFTIVTPSKWLANRVKGTFLKDKTIRVIHNGIDTDNIFYPRKSDQLRTQYQINEKKVVLAVAPNIMDNRKGGKIVLEISKLIPDVEFVLVGADESKRYSKNVLLIERTKNQEELAEWYSLADVFVICSRRENFPTTCLEAVCCGTPVVGIDEGGSKETVPEPYGQFLNSPSYEDLAYALRKVLGEKNISIKIREWAKETYAIRVMYQQYVNVYRN